jgi:hypothetical protein
MTLPLHSRKASVTYNLSAALAEHLQGYRKVSPLFVPRLLINLAAGHVSMRHGFKVRQHYIPGLILVANTCRAQIMQQPQLAQLALTV